MDQPASGNTRPWGRLVAALTACLVTLIGVICNLDPDVVLWRTLVAALLMGTLVSVGRYVVERFSSSP
jgi:hypothetical protein